MSSHRLLLVPRESPNDDAVLLVEWLVASGEKVAQGAPLCTLETSKALTEVSAPCAGWLFHLKEAGAELDVGETLAVIADSPEKPDVSVRQGAEAATARARMTRRAECLVAEHGLDLGQFEGVELIRERDVLEVLDRARNAGAPLALAEPSKVSPRQRRLALVLQESHATIPHSYLHRWIDASACQETLRRLCAADITASLSDLLVHAVATTVSAAPAMNAAWRGDAVSLFRSVNVGFALNLEDGDLVVPVIRDADRMAFTSIVARIRSLQMKAVRRKLTASDLTGGTVTVTSLVGTGVHQMLPLIVPGQSAIVAVADADAHDGNAAHCLTLAFDHRVANGAEAARFLAFVAAAITGATNG